MLKSTTALQWVSGLVGASGLMLVAFGFGGSDMVQSAKAGLPALDLVELTNDEVIQTYCVRCHSDRRLRGNLSLEGFRSDAVVENAAVGEKVINKLRAGMMPPAGNRRPEEAVLAGLAASLEGTIDRSAAAHPNPGRRTFQRLNRAEYAKAIEDLLGMEIDASAYLPDETFSGGFDNVADVQTLSPTLLDAYLNAAGEVTRLALGDANATPSEATYRIPRYASQREQAEGAPFGTRGGLAVTHYFPADGEYWFRMAFHHESTGTYFGQTSPYSEQVEIAIDGERRLVMDIDRWMHVSDPNGASMQTEPISITAGPHVVSVAFIRRAEGPLEDLMSPHEWSLADKKIGFSYGITSVPHLRDVAISGPYNPTGVSGNPVRDAIFTCKPATLDEEAPCATSIITRLTEKAYRRPITDADLAPLMDLYETEASFEAGIRTTLHGILASPDFVFRFEEPSENAVPGEAYRISDTDLATRLSYFLWGRAPDQELITLATADELSDPSVLEGQVRRMLADPRSEALGTRFAAQWLRLQDLEKVHPDAIAFPDFYQQLADAMQQETEIFFHNLIKEDRSFLEILTADYTFVNERLARHYGMTGITGDHFRKATYPTERRRGLLGHGSVLVLTSHANRTSAVLRGKWVMEVLLGSPPPPPPPDVPDLDATAEAVDGRLLTVRQRMEMHRANPSCNSCHRVIDPIGLALENFDVTGAWRIRDNGAPIDTQGELYDGTPLTTPNDLRQALLARPEPLVRTFTGNLMAYALGRRIEYFDMPAVRTIARNAKAQDYRMSAFILGVVQSDAFQWSLASGEIADGESH